MFSLSIYCWSKFLQIDDNNSELQMEDETALHYSLQILDCRKKEPKKFERNSLHKSKKNLSRNFLNKFAKFERKMLKSSYGTKNVIFSLQKSTYVPLLTGKSMRPKVLSELTRNLTTRLNGKKHRIRDISVEYWDQNREVSCPMGLKLH